MYQTEQSYFDEQTELKGYIVYDDQIELARPGVLVAHDWSGRNQFAIDAANKLAQLGYVGFAIDMYGDAKCGESVEENSTLMTPFTDDRSRLQQRVTAALNHLRENPYVDTNKIAIIGFCFGGMCALDLARTGADIRGVVSFHGLFTPPPNIPEPKIKAKILALHGHDDPMVTPDAVTGLTEELTRAGADWQCHIYGNTQHAFTNPQANFVDMGAVYQPTAAKRAWLAMENFLNEIF